MATIDPTVAGLASVHGCIGAVDPVRTFGTPEQKRRYLPKLASGERLSGFALTEPGAGSDLTALRTRAELDGDEYVVNGEKLFITNAIPGRTIGLVCLIEDKPAVLIADLPDHEDEHFQIVKYGLYALKHSYNNGLRFRDFRVPAENLPERRQGRRPDDRLSRPEPRPRRPLCQRRGHDADDARRTCCPGPSSARPTARRSSPASWSGAGSAGSPA